MLAWTGHHETLKTVKGVFINQGRSAKISIIKSEMINNKVLSLKNHTKCDKLC